MLNINDSNNFHDSTQIAVNSQGRSVGKIQVTGKRNPCPICDKTNGNCRTLPDDGVWCMTFADKFSAANHPSYRYVKPTSDGLWGIYYPRRDNDFDREQWLREKEARQVKQEETNQAALSIEDRDTAIRLILSQLTLSESDRRYLENRGLPAHTAANCRTVNRWQKLSLPVDPNLPGVSKYGNRLNNPAKAIIEAIPNHLGQFTALRLHNRFDPNQKYSWLSSGSRGIKVNLPNGELPAAVHCPTSINLDRTIGLCEGMEIKAAIAACRLGLPVMGFSGHNTMANSPKQIKECADHVGADTALILPDDNVFTNPDVYSSVEKSISQVENLGLIPLVAWFGQTHKGTGDIDEIDESRLANIEYLTPEQFWALCPERPEKAGKINAFKKWLEKQTKPKNKGLPKIEGTEYQDGLIQDLLNQGKSVLDARPPGSGKTHQVTNSFNPKGGKIWYVTGDHRNPTIEAITNEFTDLHPRNEYGYYRDDDGKLRLAKADTPKDKILLGSKGKCIRASLFPKLSELGYDPNRGGSENPICASCPKLKICRFTEGWYLKDRQEALSHSHIRADLESMPRNGYDYSKDLINLDDKLPNPIKTISATWGNLLLEFDRVRTYLSDEQRQSLDKWLQSLKPLFENKTAYGLEHQAILETLGQLQWSEDILTAIAASVIDLHSVFPKPDEIELSDTDKKAYKTQLKAFYAHAHHEASKESEENLKNLPPNALVHLVKVSMGESGITLRMVKGELILTIDRRAEFAFLNDCGLLLNLNATSSLEDLKMVGITRPLEVVKGSDKVTEHNNLTVIAIHTKGLGRNPYQTSPGKIKGISDRAINRLIALDKALCDQYGDFPVIGPKPLKELFEYSGNWFNHNRGSNDFKGLPTLCYVGLPRPNWGAVKDKYLALKGTLEGFEDYYESLINQEILQGIGRPRANRHPDKQFTVLMIVPEGTDLNWLKDYGVKVVNKSAFEITPKAGTETQATAYRIVQATKELLTKGVKVTQDAIATIVGMTQQNISKVLRAKDLTVEMIEQKLLNLLPNGYTTGPYKDSITSSCMTHELYKVFSDLFDLPMEDLVEDAVKVIQEQGFNYFWEYLSNFPKALQGKYLMGLRHLLHDESEFLSESLIT